MTFTASWSGLGRDFPGLLGIISPPVETLSDEEAEHARHIGHLASHWAAENEHQHISLSLAASIDPHQFQLILSSPPAAGVSAAAAQEASAQELAPPAVDGGPGHPNPEVFPPPEPQGAAVSDSNPFDEHPAGQPAPEPVSPAVAGPVRMPHGADPAADAQDAQTPVSPGPVAPERSQPSAPAQTPAEQPTPATPEASPADPTSPAESAGPTEQEEEHDGLPE